MSLLVNSVGQLGRSGMAVRDQSNGAVLLRRMDLWFTGLFPNGDTAVVAGDIFGTSTHWCEGPSAFSGEQRVPRTEWSRILVINESQINHHRKNYSTAGYVPAPVITDWPGNFIRSGFPAVLAPFADADLNGVYNPEGGDFPYLPGKQHVWAMGADSLRKAGLKRVSTSVDLAALWFTGKSNDSFSTLTAGLRMTLCNRGSSPVSRARLTMAADMQVGGYGNEFIETDVRNRSLLAFNGSNDSVYGARGPAMAMGWLSEKAGASIYFEPGSDAVKGSPATATHFFNLASGRWKTGTTLGWGGRGLDPTIPASFVYSGYSDPAFSRLWTESDLGNIPGKRTALISTDTFLLNAGACRVVDAFLTIIPDAGDSASRASHLAAVHDRYNRSDYTLGVRPLAKISAIRLFPNPVAAGQLIRVSAEAGEDVLVSDASGRAVMNTVYDGKGISISVPGLYAVRVAGRPAAGWVWVR